MAAAIVDNNIPFAAADTFSPLFKEMFPDSEQAEPKQHVSGMCVFRVRSVYQSTNVIYQAC